MLVPFMGKILLVERAWRRSADGEELVTLEGVLRAVSFVDRSQTKDHDARHV
jgi:hypothetical protein